MRLERRIENLENARQASPEKIPMWLIDLCLNEAPTAEERSQLQWGLQRYGRLIDEILGERQS